MPNYTAKSDDLPDVTITTDGACRGNPGPGGWAALLEGIRNDGSAHELLISDEESGTTTNNAMEVQAVIGGLRTLKKPCRVMIRLDSTYVQKGIERLLRGERINPKTWANVKQWIELEELLHIHQVETSWVRGHAGDERNERVDEAANAAAQRAYDIAETQRLPLISSGGADQIILAIQTSGMGQPVRWKLRAPAQTHHAGEVQVRGAVTEATAAWQALISGLRQATQLDVETPSPVLVQTNLELIVKQGRGEWKIKQDALKPLAAQLVQLRQVLEVDFQHRDTTTIARLLDEE